MGMETAEKRPAGDLLLYELVAGRISRLIDHGTFRPGDRIPSVRRFSREMDVSITTVMEAYRHLEDRGLIEARPQSGYYVRPGLPGAPSEPGISREPCCRPTKVSVRDLVTMVYQDTRNPSLVQLGAALPNPELLPVEKLNRTLGIVARRHGARSTQYDVAPGNETLRVQIARRLLQAGCVLTPDDIVATNGASEAIVLALSAICRPGDTVAIESPTYYNFFQKIEILGLRALELPTHPRDGISLEALRQAIDDHPIKAVLVVANYSNPMGSCMPEEKKKELVDLLADNDIPLIEDDINGDLSYSDERPKAAKAFDRKELVLLCGSFSKTLAPGYRVGWIAPGRFRREITYLKLVHNVASATPTQLAVADFLANGGYDRHLRKIRRIYARQTAQMAQAVGKHFPEGTKVTRPSGGYVLWVEMPRDVDSLDLYDKALRSGVTLAPGPIFSAKQRYRNFIRLNAAFWSDRVEEAIARLGRLAGGPGR